MPAEQIKINQISTSSGTPSSATYLRGDGAWITPGAGQASTQIFSLTVGTSTDVTTSAFPFVVGPVMIELIIGADNNGTNVYSVLWVNMRSFSGTKTADITNRTAKGPGNGGFLKMDVDRTTSGTILVISRPVDGTETLPDGTGASSFVNRNWPTGRLRVTAWEDTQA